MKMHFHTQGLAVFDRIWISVICCLFLRNQPIVATEGEWSVDYGREVVTWPGGTVVLPCSFKFPESEGTGVTGAFWKKGRAKTNVYSLTSAVKDEYKERVSLIGDLHDKNCSLKIRDVKYYDAETYVFRFELKKGFSGANGIKLTVKDQYRPLSNVKVNPATVTEGMNVTLTCETDSWPPAHNFTWMRQKVNHHKVPMDISGPKITILQVRMEDTGWYYCTATNIKGSDTNFVYLSVSCRGGVDSSVTYGAKVVHAVKGAQAMLPCLFCYYRFTVSSRVRGYWLLDSARNALIPVCQSQDDYPTDKNYHGRVSLAGDLKARNCSLLIDDVRISDAKKYVFITVVDDTTIHEGVGIEMKVFAVPDKVQAQQDVPVLVAGQPASLSCSVTNVYPADSVTITWCEEVIAGVVTKIATAVPDGTFNITSSFNFTPSPEHDVKTCACSVRGVNLPSVLQANIKLHHEHKDSTVKLVASGVAAFVALLMLVTMLLILRRRKRAKQRQTDECLNPELMSAVQPVPDNDNSVDATPQGIAQEPRGTGYGTHTETFEDEAVYSNVEKKPRKVNQTASNSQELDSKHPSEHAPDNAMFSVHRAALQKPSRTLANDDSVTYSKVSFMRKGPRTDLKNPRQEDDMAESCGPADGQTTHPRQDQRPTSHEGGAGSGSGRHSDDYANVGDYDFAEDIENEGEIVYAKLSFGNRPEKN